MSVNHPGNGELIKQEKQENLFWHDGVLTKGKMHPKTKIQSKGRDQFAFSNLLFILNNFFFCQPTMWFSLKQVSKIHFQKIAKVQLK